jgi:hypothetical protein
LIRLDKEFAIGEGNGKWEMGNGKWEMGNGKWEMGNGKWEINYVKMTKFI